MRDPNFWVKVHVEFFKQLNRIGQHFLMIDQLEGADATRRITAQPEVLHHAAIGNWQQFLVDHRDTGIERLPGIGKFPNATVQHDASRIRLVHAKQAFHQRGLSGTVLTHQRVNRSWTNLQTDIIQRLDAGKTLGNAPHFQNIGGFGH